MWFGNIDQEVLLRKQLGDYNSDTQDLEIKYAKNTHNF